MMFTIDSDNHLRAHSSPEAANTIPGAVCFTTRSELARLAATWPGGRLAEIWNRLPDATPVKRFTDRNAAVTRIWKAIQALRERSCQRRLMLRHRRPTLHRRSLSRSISQPPAEREPRAAQRPPPTAA